MRDKLLGRPTKDVDVVCDGDGIALAHATVASLPHNPQVNFFKNFGTAHIRVDGMDVEFVGARKESYSPESRNPLVEPGNLQDDQLRRDFTINALYADASGFITDPVGGIDDINARHVRFIGDPVRRIREDYLRSLRFFRFTARYAKGEADESALIAIDQERDGIAKLSREHTEVAAVASRWKRLAIIGSPAKSALTTFSATFRPMLSCVASYTAAMPPT